MTYIILGGNPVDGTEAYGPFSNGDDATRWAETDCPWDDWFLMKLKSTKEVEEES